MQQLIAVLGEENVDTLKKRLVDLIIEHTRDELENYGDYLLYPPAMQDLITEAMTDTQKKVEKMYKDAVININKDYIEKLKKYMAQQTGDTALRAKIIDYATHLKQKGNEFSKEYEISQKLFKILRETEHVEEEVSADG